MDLNKKQKFSEIVKAIIEFIKQNFKHIFKVYLKAYIRYIVPLVLFSLLFTWFAYNFKLTNRLFGFDFTVSTIILIITLVIYIFILIRCSFYLTLLPPFYLQLHNEKGNNEFSFKEIINKSKKEVWSFIKFLIYNSLFLLLSVLPYILMVILLAKYSNKNFVLIILSVLVIFFFYLTLALLYWFILFDYFCLKERKYLKSLSRSWRLLKTNFITCYLLLLVISTILVIVLLPEIFIYVEINKLAQEWLLYGVTIADKGIIVLWYFIHSFMITFLGFLSSLSIGIFYLSAKKRYENKSLN